MAQLNFPPEYTRTGTGQPLLYIPGMEGTGELFFRQTSQLASRYTVLASVLRKRTPFSYEDLTRDALCILDAESPEPAIVVGESFGGTVALHLALFHPERIRHLVLVNTFPFYRHRVRLWFALKLLRLGFSKPGNIVRKVIFGIQLRREGLDTEAVQQVLRCSFSQGLAASRQRLQLIQSHDVREDLSKIQIPVSIIAAEKDRVVPSVREAEFMASQLPHATVHFLPDEGHICLLGKCSLLEYLDSDGRLEAS